MEGSLKLARCVEWTTSLPSCPNCPKRSDLFYFQGCKWWLMLRGSSYINYRVTLENSGNEDINKNFKFRIELQHRHSYKTFQIYQSENTFSNLSSYCLIEVAERTILQEAKYFDSYSQITIVFTVLSDTDSSLCLIHKAEEKLVHKSLIEDFDKLLESTDQADIKIQCGDEAIPAHKSVLAARSRVFAAMFQADMKESLNGVINMIDVDSSTMKVFLKFIYSGKFADIPKEMLPSLYNLGDKYEISSLKRICSYFMLQNVSEENYTFYLSLAETHSDEHLKSVLTDYITDHVELMRNDSWLKFSAEHTKLAIMVYQKYVEKTNQI